MEPVSRATHAPHFLRARIEGSFFSVVDMSQEEASSSRAPLSPEEAKAATLKQIEFYFADANLPFDKFLFTLTRKDPEGWVPIETLASFKRMRPMREVLNTQEMAEALRKSEALLEVDAEGLRVRRKAELKPVTDAHTPVSYTHLRAHET